MFLYRVLIPWIVYKLQSKINSSTSNKTDDDSDGISGGDAVINVGDGSNKPEISQSSTKKVRFGDDDGSSDSDRPLTSSMS